MIRPLRARHRAIVFALAAGLPLLFWSALLARDAELEARGLAPDASTSGACIEVQWQDEHRWPGLAITTRVGRSTSDAQQAVCELEAREPLAHPDLLLYWSPTATLPAAAALPADAFLLGAWAHARRCFELPAGFAEQPGHLTLFSLGHSKVLASASLEH